MAQQRAGRPIPPVPATDGVAEMSHEPPPPETAAEVYISPAVARARQGAAAAQGHGQ
jgi:hypothetical protein